MILEISRVSGEFPTIFFRELWEPVPEEGNNREALWSLRQKSRSLPEPDRKSIPGRQRHGQNEVLTLVHSFAYIKIKNVYVKMIVFWVKRYFYQQYSRLAEKENVIYKKINIADFFII